MSQKGWTITELLVVIGCMGLLAGILTPSLAAVRDMGRRIQCVSQLRGVGSGLNAYAAANRFRMPPFKFSGIPGDLPASGHWGGSSQPDPVTFGSPVDVNLWCLVTDGILSADALRCPSSADELRTGDDSLFPYTDQFSSYCLRFPPSRDLFDASPQLADYKGLGLLGVYMTHAGGEKAFVSAGGSGANYQTVPQVMLTRRYDFDPAAAFTSTFFDPASDAVASDMFWWQDHAAAAPPPPDGITSYRTQARWCHGSEFNVLYGSGAVRTISDDGTVAANSAPPGESLVDSGLHFGKYAERIWQHFDAPR